MAFGDGLHNDVKDKLALSLSGAMVIPHLQVPCSGLVHTLNQPLISVLLNADGSRMSCVAWPCL